ncbi:uncharacterized protein CANTADRAFT_52308 [Suhomyces tanzawaensis NRRL Y-17324]|uniref:Uncharacterized protein n=1 Tax=Suhomyces tanzawaensis NRRL Y-17324 TaxID=984487 RepID=A0A1E4SIX3_9ASCO|nr:uncharacterized protein CANTADRAFT_52308 [Suhomyces tanzawaensis NRRL Y-17324]ODV79451.1 hypothetical protein CANTADRAFT_52308 [Suhomyces tanzawaensis NRRL Y-17324]
MLPRLKDGGPNGAGSVGSPNGRAQSLASQVILPDDAAYKGVDIEKLYESVLKVYILEYVNEARFRTPIVEPRLTSTTSGGSGGSGSTGSGNNASNYSKYYRSSKVFDVQDPKLPSYLLSSLESKLNVIAMKNGGNYDDMTRRSLLRFYSELLDPTFKNDILRVNKPEYLVMKFVSSANKELVKIGTIPSNEISEAVFKQAGKFVQLLIGLIKKDKDSDAIIAKLQENKESLKPKKPVSADTGSETPTNVQYPKPSFKLNDMDQSIIKLLKSLFSVDLIKLQQDINKWKTLVLQKTLHKDLQQVTFYLGKNLGQLSAKNFETTDAYHDWKNREEESCNQLLKKYQVPPAMRLLPVPEIPSGEDFYVLPRTQALKKYYVVLVKLCFELELKESFNSISDPDKPLFPKTSSNLLTTCARVWRISVPTRAVAIFTAATLTGITKDKLINDPSELAPIDLEASKKIFHLCKITLENGEMDWEDKSVWSIQDQEEWVKNLMSTYNETFFSIKDSLLLIFSKTVKPKFGPCLTFLGEYLESDSLFPKIEQSGLVKKWEKKLSKALLRYSEVRYAELLANLPRDDTLSIIHVLNICDSMIEDIKMLQKRYKNPLLGFLDVKRTVAAVVIAMFAADAKNILRHIDSYAKNKGEFIPYGDALEVYRALSEIRSIYAQVATSKSKFQFDLEKFFFPFLESWVEESGEKIQGIVEQAIKNDNYEAINLEFDDKKFSSAILDIFTLIKEFLKILNGLNWANEYHLSKVFTTLLKSISDGALYYANHISDKIMKELDEEEQRKLAQQEEDAKGDSKKTGSNWFDEVKNVVSNMNNNPSKLLLEEPYNFMPKTCVALNNLSAMMQQLTKLEDVLDPEMISQSVAAFDPKSQHQYTSHIFSLRLIKAENLRPSVSSSSSTSLRPFVTLIDTKAKRTIGKTRTINNTADPEWDEEFELTLPPNSSLTVSATVWNEKFGGYSVCGRGLIQLDPRRFKHDGIPQEIYLDLDTQGRLLVEVAVESERADAIFVMGRAHRTLKRCQERCIKRIVEKVSRFIHYCFSRANLKSICGNNGQLKPTQDQMDNAMMPLYNYLNMNLQVLAEFLTKDLLLKVMLAAWNVVVSSADVLLLPKLSSAKTLNLPNFNSNSNGATGGGWQSAVSSAVANVTNSIGIMGFGNQLTNNELETVFSWLNFLCFDFFHNDGNGPPVRDLKNEQYQALLLLPVYYDRDVHFLTQEVERLSPAFVRSLRDRNNFDSDHTTTDEDHPKRSLSRAGSIYRNKTILANATAKARAQAAKDAQEARSDPIAAQTLAEDIILRLLILRDEKAFVARRLDQRERLARSIATERLARAAAEGRFH